MAMYRAKRARRSGHPIIVVGLLLLLVAAGAWGVTWGMDVYYKKEYPQKYTEYVEKYCALYNVPKDLAYAVIYTESRFKPEAVSNLGARGLMQIMEDTYDWIRFKMKDEAQHTYDDMFDPEINTQYGIFLLSLLLEEFENRENALAAYHAGRGVTNKWLADTNYSADGKTLDKIPYRDTDYYVNKVTKTAKIYQKLYQL